MNDFFLNPDLEKLPGSETLSLEGAKCGYYLLFNSTSTAFKK